MNWFKRRRTLKQKLDDAMTERDHLRRWQREVIAREFEVDRWEMQQDAS